jgi:hypothetical protein
MQVQTPVNTAKLTLKQRAYHEMKQYFIIVVYLWVVFGLLVLYKSVILNARHIDFVAHGTALINALVLGKFVLVARAFRLGERYNDAPLIYPTVVKSALFAIVLACCKILEEVAVAYFHGQSFAEGIADIGGGTLAGILTLTFLLFVLLIPFFGFGELQRVMGEGRLAQLFLQPREVSNS